MHAGFRIAGGSVPGRDHLGRGRLLVGRNNQDAAGWWGTPQVLVALVADGCGAGVHSEVGAHLCVRLLLASLRRQLDPLPAALATDGEAITALPATVHAEVLAQLGQLATQMGERPDQTIRELLLCTLLGALITPAQTVIFAIGDGVYILNGQVTRIGPFAGNAPPYLAYALLDGAACPPELADAARQFQILTAVPTAQVETLLLATDGLLDVIARAGEPLPGKTEPLGPVAQFWEDARYLDNPDAIRRRLALANSQALRPDGRVVPGLLPDDTTLLVMCRDLAEGGAT